MSIKAYLKDIQRSWDAYGKEDPMWAILVDPQKANNRWDETEFFRTGEKVAQEVMGWSERLGLPSDRKVFLDFGCGIGRLTQAFAHYFDKCIGVDIAPSMIERAKKCNKHGTRITYIVNESDDLSRFKANSIDMIYTEYVLQHMHPTASKQYIAEMIRILKPGGLLSFHLPASLATFAYPEEGLSAVIEITGERFAAHAGDVVPIPLVIKNTGSHTWVMDEDGSTPNTPLRVTNHWHNVASKEWKLVHHHQTIPETVKPGEAFHMNYELHMPSDAGHYIAIFDVIDFNGRTFSDRGGQVFAAEVVVEPGARPQADTICDDSAGDAYRPKMEMHAVATAEVQQVIMNSGGRLIEVETREQTPGDNGWARYFVSKDA